MRFLLTVLLLALAFPAHAQTRTIDFSDPQSLAVAQTYVRSTLSGSPSESSAEVSLQNGALLITNRTPGSFGVKWELKRAGDKNLDADQIEKLSFDLKAAPNVKINWFFHIGPNFYGVNVTGGDAMRPGTIWLGRATLAPLANGWRRVEIPLREWLHGVEPLTTTFLIDEILSGNWENTDFLLAGIGGNPPGATFQVDNIRISAPDPSSPHPRAGTPFIEGNDIVWPLSAPAGLNTRDVKLRAANRDFVLSSPLLKYNVRPDASAPNGLAQELRLAAATAGLSAADGQPLSLQLLGFKDALNRTSEGANPVEAQVNIAFAAQSVPPSLPRVQFDGLANAPNADFETDLEEWVARTSITSRMELADDEKTPANGRAALRLTNLRTANSFGSIVRALPVDIAQYPVLCFDYRADDRARIDFQFTWASRTYTLRFLDRDNDPSRLGIIADIKADNLWHSATVPLLEWMKKLRPEAPSYEIRDMALSDLGWRGNARGVEVWFDNFRFAPRVTSKLAVTASLRDLTGISATAWEFDQKPLTIPVAKANGSAKIEMPLEGRAPGLWWLHLRAQNGAGNWSQTAHFPVVVADPGSPAPTPNPTPTTSTTPKS